MNKLAIILLGLSLNACGIAEDITNSDICKGKADGFCDAMLGEDLATQIDDLTERQDLTDQQFAEMQEQMNEMQRQLVEYATYDFVVDYVDPCGDKPGAYDEILMRTSSNKLIAFFENGGRRYLTILEPGLYVTTDSQRCRFEVTADMEVL